MKRFQNILILFFLFLSASNVFSQASGQKPELIMYRHNGGSISPQPLTSIDTLGTIKFNGLTATGNIRTGASIRAVVAGPVSPGNLYADLVFRTSGSAGLQNRMVVKTNGLVGIGTMDPQYHLHVVGNTHTTGDFFGRIHMDNNLATDDAPNTYIDEVYFERKQRTTLGVPDAGTHGGLFTLAPGATGKDHQLYFGDDGVYHRSATGNAASWAGAIWRKLMTDENINGTPGRIAKFTEAHKVGDSQLFENAATSNIGIGTTTPTEKLHVVGTARVTGVANFETNAIVGDRLGINTIGAPTRELDVNGDAFISNRLAVGTTNPQQFAAGYDLSVGGKVIAEEVRVQMQSGWVWADYVFEPDYKRPGLHELDQYVRANKHLPGIPSAAEVAAEGIELGDMNRRLLEKIEELTLYIIEMKKENEALQQRVEKLERNK